MPRIWPNAKYLKTTLTGAMSQYTHMQQFYSGELPLISMEYAMSECVFRINLQPMCHPSEVSYTLLPNLTYFELMPHEPKNIMNELVDLTHECRER